MQPDASSSFPPFGRLPVATVCADDEGWQTRFLATPLLARLSPLHWQQLLQGLVVEAIAAGEAVIEAGTAGADCFVLQAGRARVCAGGRTLALLEPGALFGEDALISGRLRNASVVMVTDGRVGRLSAERFERWLLHAVIRPLRDPGARTRLAIGPEPPRSAHCAHLPLAHVRDAERALDTQTAYCVVGGSPGERWLAAFLLAQQGLDALPLDAEAGP
jgi:hypothetical protein